MVLDTNVLVAAARSKNGASNAILQLLPTRLFTPVISVALFLEYEAILLQRENLAGRTPHQASMFLDYLLSLSVIQEIYFKWRPGLTDPGDDLVLELAVAGNCQYIVTHNVRDFLRVEEWGLKAIKPSQLLAMIRQPK